MITGSVLTNSFKRELLSGGHNFESALFKIALYNALAPLGPATTAYQTEGEIVAIGYTAAGMDLVNPQIFMDPASRTSFVTFDDPVWQDSVITARGALIYNQSYQQRSVCVLDFGGDQSSNHGPFHVQFPPPGPATALIRLL
jgi:hypothetical protein